MPVVSRPAPFTRVEPVTETIHGVTVTGLDRRQAATRSPRPGVLDYSKYRGHSPVLPLTERVAFVCEQLQWSV